MKYLLFLLMLPVPALAQQLSFGIGGSINTVPNIDDLLMNRPSKAKLCGTAQLAYLHPLGKRWQAGISISVEKWVNRQELFYTEDGINSMLTDFDITFARPAITTALVLNRVLLTGRNQLTAGASAGYVYVCNDAKSAGTEIRYSKGNGFSTGLQVHYTRWLKNRFGLGAGFAPRLAVVTTEGLHSAGPGKYHTIICPLTVSAVVKLKK